MFRYEYSQQQFGNHGNIVPQDGNFSSEVTSQVFVHDTVGGCEKGQDMRNEVTFVFGEPTIIFEVGCEINFFCCPE